LQYGARFKDCDRITAAVWGVIDNRGELVVGVDAAKGRCQLVAIEDVLGNDAKGRPNLFEHDRNLLAVRRRRIV
jgi:hypothetical protein